MEFVAELPKGNRGGTRQKTIDKWQPIADELMDNPNRWAKIAEDQTNAVLATQINKGKISVFEDEGFSAVSRKQSDGNGISIYATFDGAVTNLDDEDEVDTEDDNEE